MSTDFQRRNAPPKHIGKGMKMAQSFTFKLGMVMAILGLTFYQPVALAKELCKGNPKVVAPCFKVHGRVSWYNGNPSIRIWWIGTKRVLGIAGGEGAEIMPDTLRDELYVNDLLQVFGDFLVCPLTKQEPNRMQYVCMESIEKITAKRGPTKKE